MSEPTNTSFPEILRRLVETIDVANVLTEPLSRSIESLLRLSAGELHSAEASVLIRDGVEGDLRFLAGIGQVADNLRKVKIPAGKGIAGFVFSSGQPMAVADVGETDSFYAEVDRSTGFSTQMLLATPLRYNGEMIGVLEYINRSEGPPFAPFTPDEMDKAALYGDVIAALVSAYESAKMFSDFSGRSLQESDRVDGEALRSWLAEIRASPEHAEMLDLAVMIREAVSRGEAERKMCRDVLSAVIHYTGNRDSSSYLAS